MTKYERYILNRSGRRPVVCNVNKKAKRYNPAWRATLGCVDGQPILQGIGETKTLALIALAKIIKAIKRSVFSCPVNMKKSS